MKQSGHTATQSGHTKKKAVTQQITKHTREQSGHTATVWIQHEQEDTPQHSLDTPQQPGQSMKQSGHTATQSGYCMKQSGQIWLSLRRRSDFSEIKAIDIALK